MSLSKKDKKRMYDIEYRVKNREKLNASKKAWYWNNKPRKQEYDKKYRKGRRPVDKHNELMSQYGISLTQYEEMLTSQNFCCKICETSENSTTKSLSVDHCHATGAVRALLCRACNMALGGLKDSPELLRRCIVYLETKGRKICR